MKGRANKGNSVICHRSFVSQDGNEKRVRDIRDHELPASGSERKRTATAGGYKTAP